MMRREAWAGAVRTCVALLVSGITPQPYAGERGPLLERTYSTCSFSMRVDDSALPLCDKRGEDGASRSFVSLGFLIQVALLSRQMTTS